MTDAQREWNALDVNAFEGEERGADTVAEIAQRYIDELKDARITDLREQVDEVAELRQRIAELERETSEHWELRDALVEEIAALRRDLVISTDADALREGDTDG